MSRVWFTCRRDEYASGHPDIDEEHQQLLRLANDLFRLHTGPAHQQCDAGHLQTLDRLLEHVRYHFAHEEHILAAADHKTLTAHKIQHAAVLELAQRLQAQAETGEVTLGELVQFVEVEIIDKHFSTETRIAFPVDFQI